MNTVEFEILLGVFVYFTVGAAMAVGFMSMFRDEKPSAQEWLVASGFFFAWPVMLVWAAFSPLILMAVALVATMTGIAWAIIRALGS